MDKQDTIQNVFQSDPIIESMFKAGVHYGYSRSRRHPSTSSYIFGRKNRVEIFDLEKTKSGLQAAKQFVAKVAAAGGQIILASSKVEAAEAIIQNAKALNLPYVAGRWIGGTFTNFPVIRSRVERMKTLIKERDGGELAKYTKKERLLFDREIAKLERFFAGLTLMEELPQAIFLVDPKQEATAVSEAKKKKIPIVALANSDCDISAIDYPILGNDASRASITFFVNEIGQAYREGKARQVEVKDNIEH
jgi:small subunit ribosomal protein S2